MATILDPQSWVQLSQDIVKFRKFYVSNLSDDLLESSLPDGTSQAIRDKLLLRRSRALLYRNDPSWPDQIFQALTDLAFRRNESTALQEIRQSHLLNPLEDYVNHLHYFLLTANDMASGGLRVLPIGPNCSRIHDLDKLDPLMLAAYAERFEDNLETKLWSACVANHVNSSPHHPEHQIWQQNAKCDELGLATNDCPHCEGLRYLGVREMICDRVSRRVQKELGEMRAEAWDISPSWFKDLPPKWFDTAVSLIAVMKQK